MIKRTLFAGFGGQGVLLMGYVLSHGAMHKGLNVTYFPSYGAEMRGGTANCTVMISSERIGSPVTQFPQSLVAMNKASLDKFENAIQPEGFLVINSSLVDRNPARSDIRFIKVPANQIAEEVGTLQVTNMAALGAYVAGSGVVSLDAVMIALRRMIPEHRKQLLTVNEEALRRGAETAKKP